MKKKKPKWVTVKRWLLVDVTSFLNPMIFDSLLETKQNQIKGEIIVNLTGRYRVKQ